MFWNYFLVIVLQHGEGMKHHCSKLCLITTLSKALLESWPYLPLIPAVGRCRICEFKASQVCIVNSRTARATYRVPALVKGMERKQRVADIEGLSMHIHPFQLQKFMMNVDYCLVRRGVTDWKWVLTRMLLLFRKHGESIAGTSELGVQLCILSRLFYAVFSWRQ